MLYGVHGVSGSFDEDKSILILPRKEREYICCSLYMNDQNVFVKSFGVMKHTSLMAFTRAE
jgi:hypothetical protein